jgi:hypothetical protein
VFSVALAAGLGRIAFVTAHGVRDVILLAGQAPSLGPGFMHWL